MKLEEVEWGEYRLGDLFEIGTGSLLSNNELKIGQTPRISAKSDSNGIYGYFDTLNLSNARHFENFITVNFFGADGGIFYHPYKASVEMKVHTLKIKNVEFNLKTGKFIATALKLSLNGFGYGSQLSSSKLQHLGYKIQLPTKNGEIDFDFMEIFIAELEAGRIAELEAYLLATGLKDYTLTQQEQQALDDFDSNNVEWGEYRIQEVLEWQSQKEINPIKLYELKDDTEIIYPFYGQSTLNNGIISFHQLTNKVLNNKNGKPTILIHSNNQNIIYLENPFYLKDGHGATSVLQSEKLNRLNQNFIISAIDKVIKHKYSYNNKATKIELKNTKIQLPTKNNQPNYEIMETFVSAIQKLVIKDVVIYADRKIQATKTIVNKLS